MSDQLLLSDVLKFAHVDSGTLGTRATLERPVGKESVVDNVVVDLRNDGRQVVVLSHEGHEFWGRPVDG